MPSPRRVPQSVVAVVTFITFITFVALTLLTLVAGCASAPEGQDGSETLGAEVTQPPALPPGDGDDGDDGPIVAVDDSTVVAGGAGLQQLVANSQMKAIANVNLRKGPATTYAVLAVIPSGATVTLLDPKAQNGFLNVEFNGTAGWASAGFLTVVAPADPTADVDVDGPPSPDNAIARAKAAVGFSYHWGGGAWLGVGVSASSAGSCTGSCPSCTHSGKYGADCSGLVAKAWQFGVKALDVDSHPYSTATFVAPSSNWSSVARTDLRKGDALVYNSGGQGHIVLYEKGDGWGTPTVLECRGCAYGCVYNARSFTSEYQGIRRTGF